MRSRSPFVLAALLLSLAPSSAALAQPAEMKLGNLVHEILAAQSVTELDALTEEVELEVDTSSDYATLGIVVRLEPGTDLDQLAIDCGCGLNATSAVPAPPLDPNDPDVPRYDVAAASIPVVIFPDPAENLGEAQPLIALASQPDVVFVAASTVGRERLNISTNNTGIFDPNDATVPVNFLGANAQILHPLNIDGRGVVVGVVDSGIDWRHTDFVDPDTGCTRIEYIWDQRDVIGRCTAPAPPGQCNPGPAGDTFCGERFPVCTLSGVVRPCVLGLLGTVGCVVRTGNPLSVCGPAPAAVCNAVNPGTKPAGFAIGAEWDEGAINQALGTCVGGPVDPTAPMVREVDRSGHGTHVAGIAAGNGSATGGGEPFIFEGMAPQSKIIFIRTNWSDRGVIEGVRYVFERAGDRAAVVNLSLGDHEKSHEARDPYSEGVSQLAGVGRLIVGAAGNEGDVGLHADNRALGGREVGDTQSLTLFVDPAHLPLPDSTTVHIFHHNGDRYRVIVTGPGGSPTISVPAGTNVPPVIADGTRISVQNARPDFTAGGSASTGIRIRLSTAGAPAGVKGGRWTITMLRTEEFVGDLEGDGLWDAWVATENTRFVTDPASEGRPTNTHKVISPAAGANVIAVAGHNTKNIVGGPFGTEPLGKLTSFSSPGPTRDGQMKPELSAPGFMIGSTCARTAGRCSLAPRRRCNPLAMPDECPAAAGNCVQVPCNADGTHVFKTGTSMASPHVAGCLALMLQQQDDLDPAGARQALLDLIRTDVESTRVRRDPNGDGIFEVAEGTDPAPHWNRDFGWGKLNCALKAENDPNDPPRVLNADGAFFSVEPEALGADGTAVADDNDPAHIFVGARRTNGLGIHKDVLRLRTDDDVDAHSFKIDPRWLVPKPRLWGLEFSVDETSPGKLNSEINKHAHPQGHIWISRWPFWGLLSALFGAHQNLYHEFELGLLTLVDDKLDGVEIENPLLPVRDNLAMPPTVFPAHRAFPIVEPRPGGVGLKTYFSLDPDSPTLAAIGARPSDVLSSTGDSNAASPTIEFQGDTHLKVLSRGDVGCQPPDCDDVDGFFIDHLGFQRFTLARNSPTLGVIGASAADVLAPGFVIPHVFIPAEDLDLDPDQDEMDALDVEICRFTALERFIVKNACMVERGAYIEAALPGGRVHTGRGVVMDKGTLLAADIVRIGNGSIVANVAANLISKGSAAVVSGFEIAAPKLPMVVDFVRELVSACSRDPKIKVLKGETRTLEPGTYGDVLVQNGAALVLRAGNYTFCSLRVGRNSIVETQGSAAARITVGAKLSLGGGSRFGPAVGTPVPKVEVTSKKSVRLKGQHILAHVRAPWATVRIGRFGIFRGSLLAKRVGSDHSCKIGCPPDFGDGLPAPAP